jgi:hypothetical protein
MFKDTIGLFGTLTLTEQVLTLVGCGLCLVICVLWVLFLDARSNIKALKKQLDNQFLCLPNNSFDTAKTKPNITATDIAVISGSNPATLGNAPKKALKTSCSICHSIKAVATRDIKAKIKVLISWIIVTVERQCQSRRTSVSE